ncbi:MAG: PSD1 and planctomycete cytochrome C domain-containing protein [Pirellulaceae bacterium]|nr:PSD1 and planctomycete cytochrome C domain-containing protein [Pirellulaceae bacterium]
MLSARNHLPQLWICVTSLYMCLSAALPAQELQYNRDVRPILSEKCFACHGFDKTKRQGNLRLDNRDGALADADSGNPAIKPGNAAESELIRRILSTEEGEMMPPPESGKQLSDQQETILQNWVDQGAKYEAHWAFVPPKKAPVPGPESGNPQAGDAHSDPIDAFVRDRLKLENLQPSRAADPITLIRRLSLDLIGLPPTIKEVDDFVAQTAEDPERAYQDLVERLLRSPNYGERWGRWWLDQARYADSNGYSVDAPRQIWKYRDWVIDALNRDLPFDQFTIEQLAGDLLPSATIDQRVATGFHRNTQINQEGGIDPEQFRIDSVFDRVATTGTVWLGLTIGCCQCHDHKFDPIEQKEYYQFFAFFNNQEEPNLTVYDPKLNVTELQAEKKSLDSEQRKIVEMADGELQAWEANLTVEQKEQLSKPLRKILDTERSKRSVDQLTSLFAAGPAELNSEKHAQFKQIQARLAEIDKQLESGVPTLVMQELAKPRKTTVFIQGDFTRPADEVNCGTPSILPKIASTNESLNRLDLARWLVSRDNPLTARVIVNRVWQHYFGRGLVETDNDFGLQGAPPSHPELLDWLAVEFMERGWSLKELHRRIVTSKTYRQVSEDREDLQEKDPGNYLLGRQRRLRLDAEIVRDVGLAASGLLSKKIGGPPVYPPIPNGVMGQGQVKRDWKVSEGEDRFRRGLYTFVYRATPPPALSVFDAPEGFSSCTRRIRSNTPLQALTLMNDASFFEFASALQKVIDRDGIEVAFRQCVARPPQDDELAVLKRLDSLSAARVLLNLDETVTRE